MLELRYIQTLEKRLQQLKLKKDMKKDYYKAFPSIQVYKEICKVICQIRYLEDKLII
jgi:hypothetical protein